MLKIRPTLPVFLLGFALLAGCTSGPDIRTDHDPNVDFSQFKTYNFFDPLGIDNPGYTTIYSTIFKNAISREMEARGYTKSDNPDLLMNVSARLQDKTKVTTYNDPSPYYGYRRGYYGAWGGYGYNTSTHVDQYTEGTVNIDMVDARAKQMVWEGVAVGRIKEERSNEELTEGVNSAVATMLRNNRSPIESISERRSRRYSSLILSKTRRHQMEIIIIRITEVGFVVNIGFLLWG